ncbi:MAG: hypothetical protein QG621_358 [Patescibacteria group bacterium]|nr:hypothetical protein [Patescibacteria group bacterium]
MNTTIALKLGEVLAFTRVGKESIDKGKEVLGEVLHEDKIEKISADFDLFAQKIEALAKADDVTGDVSTKARETEEKVRSMREIYLADGWDDESEVLEWMGFSTGAVLVHWYLLAGAAEALQHAELTQLTTEALEFYTSFFTTDEKTLKKLGAQKVS